MDGIQLTVYEALETLQDRVKAGEFGEGDEMLGKDNTKIFVDALTDVMFKNKLAQRR